MNFDYLKPAQGEVIDGLEKYERIYALDQMDKYLPLRTLPGEHGESAIYRCELTPEQRKMVAEGADVLVEILHFREPLPPSRVMLVNQNLGNGQSKEMFARYFAVMTKAPYEPAK